MVTLTKSGAYYGNLHYDTDENTSVNNNDQLTSDIKNDDQLPSDDSNLATKKVDNPIDDNPINIFEDQYLDSESQPLETSNLLQTHNGFLNPDQGPEQSFIPLPLPEFDITPDVPINSHKQLIEPTLGDATLNQDVPQNLPIGSVDFLASENFSTQMSAVRTRSASSPTASDGSQIEVFRDTVAQAPTVTANDVSGNEDTAIALDITSALADTDGSETLSVTISGVPSGASLSAGTDNGDGTWTLIQAQLTGLTLTPPTDDDADFTLTVTSTSTEGNGGDTAQTIDTFDVTVTS